MKIILKLIPLLLVCLFAVGCGKKVESIPPVESVTVTTSEITTTLVTTAVSATATTAPPAETTTVTVPPVPATTPPPTTTKAVVTKYTGSTETESNLVTPPTMATTTTVHENVAFSTDKPTYKLDDELTLTLSNSSEKEFFRYSVPGLKDFTNDKLVKQILTYHGDPTNPPDEIAVNKTSPIVIKYNLRSDFGNIAAGRYGFLCMVRFDDLDPYLITAEFEIVE